MSDSPSVVVIGGGVIGLCTAMLLARDGHHATLLESDAALPPEPGAAWDRPGRSQFRLPHFFLPRFRELLEIELPDVAEALFAAGAAPTTSLTRCPRS